MLWIRFENLLSNSLFPQQVEQTFLIIKNKKQTCCIVSRKLKTNYVKLIAVHKSL